MANNNSFRAVNKAQHISATHGSRNISSSSDGLIDTSDEQIEISQTSDNVVSHFIAGICEHQDLTDSRGDSVNQKRDEPTPEERAEQIVLEAEQSHARMYNMSGELSQFKELDLSCQSFLMDEDYQMIDVHIEESTKQKKYGTTNI